MFDLWYACCGCCVLSLVGLVAYRRKEWYSGVGEFFFIYGLMGMILTGVLSTFVACVILIQGVSR
jgi:hypothetical protein